MILPGQKRNLEFLMESWGSALVSYGTPADFASDSYVKVIPPSADSDKELAFHLVIAPGNDRRGELMKKQSEEMKARKDAGLAPRWAHDYDACFLCGNVGQAAEVGDNLLLPAGHFEKYVLMPNKYPALDPHMLLVAKEHDSSGLRVGYAVNSDYLGALDELSRRYGLVAVQNHPKAGMSIPGHEHAHLWPVVAPDAQQRLVTTVPLLDAPRIGTKYGTSVKSVDGSRFATLVFDGPNAMYAPIHVMKAMEQDDRIFTFLLHEGSVYLTAHAKEARNANGGFIVTAGNPGYFGVGGKNDLRTFDDMIKEGAQGLEPKGFSWDRYM